MIGSNAKHLPGVGWNDHDKSSRVRSYIDQIRAHLPNTSMVLAFAGLGQQFQPDIKQRCACACVLPFIFCEQWAGREQE